MAILRNFPDKEFSGNVEKRVVIRQRLGKTIISVFPDMSNVKYNESQQIEQKRFADAVAYAKEIIQDPDKKALYKSRLPKGKKVFNAAIAE